MDVFAEQDKKVEQAFFEKIERGEKISDPSELPLRCHELLARTILMNFFAEWWGGINYFRCLSVAPNDTERDYMEVIAREELGHAHILAKGSLAVLLGGDPYRLLASTVKKQINMLRVFQYPEVLCRSWGDVLIFNRLQDASADMQLDEFSESWFEPYCNDIAMIEAEEVGHVQHAERAIREYYYQSSPPTLLNLDYWLQNHKKMRLQLQTALDFWLPLVLEVFGKPNGKNEQLYLKYKLKHRTNEESRQLFISRISPFFKKIGLTHPLLNQ